MQSVLIDVGGGRSNVRVYQGGTGEPLLYLHGAGGLLADDPFLARLSERYRVFAPLLPGYEDSDGADNLHDMLDITLHCFDVMEALGLRRPILVGHSMGGMIAAEMAAVAPHEVERLGLIASAGLWLDANPIPDVFALLPYEWPGMLFHDVALGTRLLTSGLNMEDPKFMTEFLIQNAKRLGTAGKLLFPIPDRGLADRLYRVRARTVVIWGEADKLVVPAYGEAFRHRIKGADLVRIADAGHMVGYEKPDAVLSALARLQ